MVEVQQRDLNEMQDLLLCSSETGLKLGSGQVNVVVCWLQSDVPNLKPQIPSH